MGLSMNNMKLERMTRAQLIELAKDLDEQVGEAIHDCGVITNKHMLVQRDLERVKEEIAEHEASLRERIATLHQAGSALLHIMAGSTVGDVFDIE